MNKKIILTSFIALGFACPAMAEPSHTDEFPSNGLMQEDYTYTNSANETNMAGVSGHNATVYANALYSNASYAVVAGEYLPADAEVVATCTAGSFCPGGQSYGYNATTAQGITACSTVGDNSFTLSAAGASANTDCYKACNIANMGQGGSIADIPHAASLTGNDYYGNGTDTCEPATCVTGWHVKDGLNVATEIGTTAGVNSAYVNNSGTFGETDANFSSGNNGAAYYGLSTSNHNTWAVEYDGKGIVVGQGRCSTRGVTTPWYETYDESTDSYTVPSDNIVSSLTDETGQTGAQYCYCNVTGYKASSSSALQSLSSSWVFRSVYGDASDCASDCAYDCADNMRDTSSSSLAFRGALLGSVGALPASCEVNTINISWDGATAAAVSANNAASVTYGGDIRTPKSAIHVKGKVFDGWEFSTTAPVSPVTEPVQQ